MQIIVVLRGVAVLVILGLHIGPGFNPAGRRRQRPVGADFHIVPRVHQLGGRGGTVAVIGGLQLYPARRFRLRYLMGIVIGIGVVFALGIRKAGHVARTVIGQHRRAVAVLHRLDQVALGIVGIGHVVVLYQLAPVEVHAVGLPVKAPFSNTLPQDQDSAKFVTFFCN